MPIRRLYGPLTIAWSAALLFLIQPIMAKALLPRFGGSAGVWVTCMMFFQVVLLLGYLYSFWISRYASPAVRTAVHLGLLAASLLVLPVRAPAEWVSGNPVLAIPGILAASAGLPFFMLSTTTTLVQCWHSGRRAQQLPYWLFAVSNSACVLALLSYPLAIEPGLATSTQLRWWSAGYLIVAVLLGIGVVSNRGWRPEDEPGTADADALRPTLWIALSATASALWLAVANYLSQEVAAIPLLWVLPLALYLLSFVLCFASDGFYRPAWFRWLLPACWVAIGSRIGLAGTVTDLRVDLLILLGALFVLCLFCHGELARTRPRSGRGLPFFYLMAATGGALGGIFVAVAAPAMFTSYLELPVAIAATMLLSMVLIYGVTSRGRLIRLGTLSIAALVVASSFQNGATRVAAGRNFYGALQIRDSGEGERAVRTLYSGRTIHGVQFLAPARSRIPTAYYGMQSGIGLLLGGQGNANRRVAMVGLGAGTLAAYGRKGDFFRFYEINPAVIEAAAKQFRFVADSAAEVSVVQGDGRLRLEQEPPGSFDAIVLDAFSDDAIPVHLLTREAFQAYFARLRERGAVAIHVTNRYLDLRPVLESVAATLQKKAVRIASPADPEQQVLGADWVVVSNSDAIGETLGRRADSAPVKRGPLWTDEYSNLIQVWR